MEGEDHKMAKAKVCKELRGKGFETEKEYRLENGMIVDVYADNGEKEVAVEVGTLHGENRIDRLKNEFDEVIHVTQFGKPDNQSSEYTTVSFRQDFIEKLRVHMSDTYYDSARNFLKHLAVKDMESEEKISEEEAKEIGKKLKELGYMG